jgi:(4-O-methyl)-D-glucuronate---lignin esterase
MKNVFIPLLAVALFPASMIAAENFPELADLAVSTEPPDPLVMRNGERVTTREQWFQRRAPELRALFEHYMYGRRPPVVGSVQGKRIREDKGALGGKAALKEVLVDCGLEEPVHLLIILPNQAQKPVPCFLGLNFSGNHAVVADPKVQMPKGWVPQKYAGSAQNRASEQGRASEIETWAIEQSIERGYAVATFYHGDIVPDEATLAQERLKRWASKGQGADGGGDDSATIMAWAWGFSRMIDYLVAEPAIDPKRIAVVGHSRNGKTALLAAALDERIALSIPTQAGCGGTAPSRVAPELAALNPNGRPTAETIAVINRSFPHWFCANFKKFNDTPEKLPFDQHALISLCAPRPVLLSNATEDQWANPTGQFDMLRRADPVYRLVSGEGCDAKTMPETGKLLDSRLGYFIRPGKHSMTSADWKVWLDYADKWLR